MKKCFLSLFFLLGCAITYYGSYSNSLQTWIGKSEYQLYNVWGMPVNVGYISPKRKLLNYVKVSNKGRQDVYDEQIYYKGINDRSWWNRVFGPPRPQTNSKYYCKTSFVVENGIIVGFNFNGDYCSVKKSTLF